MIFAIIDLGTNTFNLLIGCKEPSGEAKLIYQTKQVVKLGEGGISKKIILPEAIARAVDALQTFNKFIREYKVEKTIAIATSAVREAVNKNEFLKAIKNTAGIDITVVSGDEEAQYIYYGVKEALQLKEMPSLIMDIGGGSTEFILANKDQLFWKQSFLLGVALLLEQFPYSDPITSNEVELIENHLKSMLQPLFKAIEKHQPVELIGSSGSFDTFAEMIAHQFYVPNILENKTEYHFDLSEFKFISKKIMNSDKKERIDMKGLIAMRADMIVLSSILVNFILRECNIHQMRLSTYSLKEGVLTTV